MYKAVCFFSSGSISLFAVLVSILRAENPGADVDLSLSS